MTATPPTGRVDFGAGRKPIRLRGWVSGIVNTRAVLLVLASVVGCILVTIAAIALGDYPVPVTRILPILSGADLGFANTVVLQWRLPRAVATVTFGAALGISGAIFQSVTRNALGSPDVIGFNAGAFTGAIISIGYLGGSQTTTTLLALVGGATAAFAVYALASRRGVSGTRFVIIGIAVSMALIAFDSLLVLRMEQQVATVAMTWGQGDLENIRWQQVTPMCLILAVVIVGAGALGGRMRQLELGDDAASATGVSVEPVRLALIAVGVALTAVVTSVCGPIAFIALAAPHLARLVAGSAGTSLTSAAAAGALLLSSCDLAAQHLLTVQIPVGVVTVVAGGAYLLWLITWKLRRPRG
ncbi:FecCD family ABC transporter permease [Actinopolymorpha pittospori]|uniref:Iron complex transport system permease protein n=1 Tax=Actinopolymorpha pittospori TaxID=648752 RepID=A0A927MNV0_9ACTN|nr:iron chelate uptake ABC transporter family permease subunit [Actinopolymorpha pittospori]MBE1603412.1 iron complex transport system permease protein [Actinopolymorpha pittospori]